MKKIIALTAITLVGSALAQTTTEGELSTSQKSFSERLGVDYYGELTKQDITEEENSAPDTDLYNSLGLSYEVAENITSKLEVRWTNADNENDEGERQTFNMIDPRLRVDFKRANAFVNKIRLLAQLPATEDSRDADLITGFRAYAFMTGKKIDDYNTINAVSFFEKAFYEDDPTPGADETRNFRLYQGINWVNTALSEKYRPKVEVEFLPINPENKAVTHLEWSGSERLLAGIDTEIYDVSVFPYLIHKLNSVKAVDQLGAGMQIYKSF